MAVLAVVEALSILLLGVLVAGLLRSHADVLRRLHELGAGLDPDVDESPATPVIATDKIRRVQTVTGNRPAFDIAGVTPSGDAVVMGVAGAGHQTMLAFLSSGCSTCLSLWRSLANETLPALPGRPRIVVVTRGPQAESLTAIASLASSNDDVVMSDAAWNDYSVPGAPYFVFVDGPSSTVAGEGSVRSWTQLIDLVRQAGSDEDMASSFRAPRGGGAAREQRIDGELAAAGILPGDPSLYVGSPGSIPTK